MKLEMKNCIDINEESATILPLSSGKVDIYKFLKGQKILPFWSKESDRTS